MADEQPLAPSKLYRTLVYIALVWGAVWSLLYLSGGGDFTAYPGDTISWVLAGALAWAPLAIVVGLHRWIGWLRG